MALYRNISMSFWTDAKVIEEFSPEDKYFMLYCLTNPYTNLCGCYEISIKQMIRDTGYNEETIEKLLNRLNDYGVIRYDKTNKELYIVNWSKYNWTRSEKLDKPLLEEIKKIKTQDFKKKLVDLYNKRDTVSIPYIYTMDTTVSVSVSDTVSNTVSISKNNRKFKKPTLEEIKAYCKERNNNVDAKKFFDYYEAGKWKDKEGKQIKNWKQKVITWEGRNQNNKKEETLPDWFNKELKNEPMTEKEKDEVNDLLEAIENM